MIIRARKAATALLLWMVTLLMIILAPLSHHPHSQVGAAEDQRDFAASVLAVGAVFEGSYKPTETQTLSFRMKITKVQGHLLEGEMWLLGADKSEAHGVTLAGQFDNAGHFEVTFIARIKGTFMQHSLQDGRLEGNVFNEGLSGRWIVPSENSNGTIAGKLKASVKQRAPEAKFAGRWNIEIPTQGHTYRVTVTLEQKGAAIGGRYTFEGVQTVTVEQGKVDRNKITFNVAHMFGGQPIKLQFEGQLDGDSLTGDVRFERPNSQGSFKFNGRRERQVEPTRVSETIVGRGADSVRGKWIVPSANSNGTIEGRLKVGVPRREGVMPRTGRVQDKPAGERIAEPEDTDGAKVYPAPAGEPLSKQFTVQVNGKDCPVYSARVNPASQKLRIKKAYIGNMNRAVADAQYGPDAADAIFDLASFAYFDMRIPVEVAVSCPTPIRSAKVLPKSFKIVPVVNGKTLKFSLPEPRLLTIEVNGDWVHSLHLFANPFETDPPSPDDPNVIYFGPGIHEVRSIGVGAGKTVYIAGGAIVRAVVGPDEKREPAKLYKEGATFALYGKNATLRGRGIIDGSRCPGLSRVSINLWKSSNMTVEGVIVRDQSIICLPMHGSDHVLIKNLKIIGHRIGSDGIDIYDCHDTTVDGCFVRSGDDLIIVNPNKPPRGTLGASRIVVKDCVLWSDKNRALAIGPELPGADLDDVLFTNCDVIHDKGLNYTLDVLNAGVAHVRNVRFKDIRVEESLNLMSVHVGKCLYSHKEERGRISRVTFENIRARVGPRPGFHERVGSHPKNAWNAVGTVTPQYYFPRATPVGLQGFDASHSVEDVTFTNVVINGKPLTHKDVSTNSHVRGVQINP